MLDIAKSKNWDINKLDLKGSQQFKDECNKQIKALSKNNEHKQTMKEIEQYIKQNEKKDQKLPEQKVKELPKSKEKEIERDARLQR